MSNFKAKRAVKTYVMDLPFPPERIFPLLCPTREYDWIDYWECRLVYSESGFAENNCVFTTSFPDRGEMTWVVSRYDPPRTIEFTVFTPGVLVWKLDIVLQSEGGDRTKVAWTHAYTAVTDKGNMFIDHYTDEDHRKRMDGLERALRHFCRTGEMLRGEPH